MKGNFRNATKGQKIVRSIEVLMIVAVCLLIGILLFSSEPSFLLFGHAAFVVSSSSMEPAYPINSLVFIRNESFASLEVGDVIVFKAQALSGQLAMHRIVEKAENGYYTKGDNNDVQDNQLITPETYVGKIVLGVTFFAAYLALLASPMGFVLFFVLPVLVVAIICLSVKMLLNKDSQK